MLHYLFHEEIEPMLCTIWKSLSYVSLSDPLGYTVHGILLTRILECVVIPFSRESSQPRDGTQVSWLQADSLPAEPLGKQL